MRLQPSPGASGRPTEWSGECGFALVAVLLALGLLAMIASTFMLAVRAHVRTVAATAAAARAEAGADGGVSIAVLDLLLVREDRTRPRRFPVDSTAVACRLEDGSRLQIGVQDEAGRVDLNSAGEALIVALLRGSGFDEGAAVRSAQRILDYRDRDDDRRPEGAERPEYVAAGLPGPKNGPFDAVDEVAQVLGGGTVLDRLRGTVTVHSGLAGVDPRVMGRDAVARLAAGAAAGSAVFAGLAKPADAGALPPRFVEVSPQQVYRIRSIAQGGDGAMFVREVVVDLGPRRARSHTFRRWTRGSLEPVDGDLFQNKPVTALPPC